MRDFHYFDNAATTMISDRALEAYGSCCRLHMANPSASYATGRESKAFLEECRLRMAKVLGVQAGQLFFTSGASESIAIVMESLLWAKSPGKVLISALEHEAVSSFTPILKEKGWTVEVLPAKGGFISPETLEAKLTKDVRLVAVMAVSNVLGTVQDIDGLVGVTRRKEAEFGRPILFFSDCVQAFGKAELRLRDWALDAASFSAHKIHGPRGVGLLYLKKGQIQSLSHAGGQEKGVRGGTENLPAIAAAGGQEKGVRGGTENLPAIAAFTVAAEELAQRDEEQIRRLNDIVRTGLEGTKYSILTPREGSTPYILTIAGPLPSEVAMRMLQDRGFLLSSGSACSNNERGKAEAIFRASGFGKAAGGALRISFSHDNTPEEAQLLVEALKEIG